VCKNQLFVLYCIAFHGSCPFNALMLLLAHKNGIWHVEGPAQSVLCSLR